MKNIILMLSIVLVASCSTVSIKKINENDKLNSEKGYIYGKFLEIKGANSIEIELETLDLNNKKEKAGYIKPIKFSYKPMILGKAKPYKVFSLFPGTYKLTRVTLIYENKQKSMKLNNEKYAKPFKIEKNTIYYLGDFYASSIINHFKITEYKNNYEETTKIIKEKYKYLTPLKSEVIFK